MFVIFAHEDLDGMLLRAGIEINDGSLTNVLNMALFSVLKKRFNHMWSSFYWLVFAWTLARDNMTSTTTSLHPAWCNDIARKAQLGSPRTFCRPTRSHCSEISGYIYDNSCSQLSSFEILGTPNQDPVPCRRPLKPAGAPSPAHGDPWRGSPARRVSLEKF